MARKVVAQQPQRRSGVNRAQLKALAARQAMTVSAASTARRPTPVADGEATEPAPLQFGYTPVAPRGRRGAALTREQEYAYIRGDLIRLSIIAAIALAILLVLLVVLR